MRFQRNEKSASSTGSAQIASSGDAVADAATRKRFIEAYDAKHQVAMDGADKAKSGRKTNAQRQEMAMLEVGAKDGPTD